MTLALPVPVLAQSTAELELLNDVFTIVVTGDAVIDNDQYDDPSGTLTATASDELGRVSIGRDSLNSDAVSGSFPVIDNTIFGNATSNDATNTISAVTTPALDEQSAIANNQVNSRDVTALSNSASIFIDIELDEDFGSGFGSGFVAAVDGATLLLDGNEINVSATGNIARNTIEVDGAVSIDGTFDAAAITISDDDLGTTGSGASTSPDLRAIGDLVIANGQINDVDNSGFVSGFGLTIGADLSDAIVNIEIDSTSGSTIELTDNALSATAKGNVVTSTILTADGSVPSDPGARASIDAGLAIASLQAGSDGLTVEADVSGNYVGVLSGIDVDDFANGVGSGGLEGTGDVIDSTINVADNSLTATAYNNQAVQTLSITANTVNGDNLGLANILDLSGSGGTDTLRVDADISIGGMQLLEDTSTLADVRSNNLGVSVYSSGSVDDSTIAVDGNELAASAIGNIAVSSAIQIDANTAGTSVGVASVQLVSGSVIAAYTGDNGIGIELVTDVSDSTVEVTDNTVSSAATANLASSAIEIATNRILVADDLSGGVAISTDRIASGFFYSGNFYSGSLPHVAAGYAVLNNQTADGVDVTAVTRGDTVAETLGSYISGLFDGGTVDVDGNDVTAAVRVNEAATALDLSANEIDASGSGYTALGGVALNQYVDQVSGLAQSFVDVVSLFNADVTDSTISTSDNVVSADVTGNLSTGTVLTLNVGSVDLDMSNSGALWDADDDQFEGSFVVASAQAVSGGTLFATLRDHNSGSFSGAPIDSAEIRTELEDDLTRSTVASNDNTLSATVTGNAAVSTITIDATGSFDAQTGIVNLQRMDDFNIDATIGIEGSLGTPGRTETAPGIVVEVTLVEAFSVDGTVTAGVWNGSLSGLTADEIDAFLDVYSGQPGFSYDVGTGDVSFNSVGSGALNLPVAAITENQYQFDISELSASGLTAFEADYPTATVVGSTASFTTLDAVGETDTFVEVFGGTPSVDPAGGVFVSVGADISGSTIEIAGNLIEGAVTGNQAVNTVNVAALELQRNTDSGAFANDSSEIEFSIGILSEQVSESGAYNSTVFGAFAIEADVVDDRTDSTLVISANDQTSTATANDARNVMVADVGTFSSSLAVNNDQVMDDSGSVNAFSAMSVTAPMDLVDSTLEISDNTNSAVATANIGVTSLSLTANIANAQDSGAVGNEAFDSASADIVVFSRQRSSGEVEAEAESFIRNAFEIETPSTVDSSTITLDGNVTVAEATQNRATNSLAIDGNTINSSAVLFNEQDADDDSTATAVSTVSVVLNAASAYTLDDASVAIDGNRTSALAFGSVATNTMAINANQLNGRDNASVQSQVLRAQYGVVNDQDQNGDVTATSNGTIYQIALNAEGATDTLASVQSSSSVINNVVSAQAVANYSSNSLAVTGLSASDVGVAVYNTQSNSGDVIARVGTTTIGISTTGDFGGMSMVGDNVVGATAVGNSATNLITR